MATRRLEGKVCIVTGSSSGLGRAIAIRYAAEGALVVCADLRPTARQEVPSEQEASTDEVITTSGGKCIFVQTDVSQAADVKNLVDAAVAKYGRLDVMVNNAGIAVEARQGGRKVHETSEEVFDTTIAVNLKSVFLGCKYATAQMLLQEAHQSGDRGWIINMASILGLVGGTRSVSYSTSKGAVVNLTRSVALDYAENRIHCNAICPGFVETAIYQNTISNLASTEIIHALHPFGGVGKVKDIAGAAVFLASEDASWVTGISLPVDGGYTAR